MKLCIITCYKQPDYVRARTLRAAADAIDQVEVLTVKNTHTGVLRYGEVMWKTLKMRLNEHPDAYLLTFRGYEMLLPVRLLSIGKPLLYDEFINPIEWAVHEHRKLPVRSPATRLFARIYRALLKSVNLVLTDTDSHADLSSQMMNLPREKFMSIPVGTDEATFLPREGEAVKNERFKVFYYGNMLPLHGLKYVIDAAVILKEEPVTFVLIGGSDKTALDVKAATSKGVNIEYKSWVEYDVLPELMRESDLCLAGPFGGTFQSEYVITGKAYQYLSMGRPTIVGENRESRVFQDKKDALIVPQADAPALANTIRWAVDHRTELSAIGRAGRELFDSRYTTEHLSVRLEEGLTRLGLLQAATGANQNKPDEHRE